MQESTAWRLRVFSGQLAGTSDRSPESLVRAPCRAEQAAQTTSRFCSCDEALECIQDGDSVAVNLGFARHGQGIFAGVDTGLSARLLDSLGVAVPSISCGGFEQSMMPPPIQATWTYMLGLLEARAEASSS